MRYFLFLSVIFSFHIAQAQDSVVVFGYLTDLDSGLPVDYATVYVQNTPNAVETDLNGKYRLLITADRPCTIVYGRIGYRDTEINIPPMKAGSKRNVNVRMAPSDATFEVVVNASKIEDLGMVREEVAPLRLIPSASGNFESVLPSIALGLNAGTGGELSSQYNVRGGNYDENLVYVNDFEIFRPQLIRAGSQEGLSFPNIDLMRDLSFSSGGFDARYGDKMSSVLDINYKRPTEWAGSISASLLGATGHIEGSKKLGPNAYNQLRVLLGARYKDTRYLLGSQELQGEYTPAFSDIQSFITYDITRDLQVGALLNYNDARYQFVPSSRSTTLGLFNEAIRFSSVFEGREDDRFVNGTTGLSLTWLPQRDKNPIYLKLLGSRYQSYETENIDIIGFYRLSEVETGLGEDDFGQEVAVLGTGTDHNYVRNRLFSTISTLHLKGGLELTGNDKDQSHFFQYGIKYQNETFDDELNEWNRIDSAGYSLPFSENVVALSNVYKSENLLENNKIESYLQHSYSLVRSGSHEVKIVSGVRASYADLNGQLLWSPRASILYKPLGWSREMSFKLAGGIYNQPPLYREMRAIDGSLNTNVLAQRSTHLVAGMTYDFQWEKISRKPFRLITEVYYKSLSDLVSYELDNVRIRYSGLNDSDGHAYGLDIRVNGEFVPGAESWVNLSFLQTRESIRGIQHRGFVEINGERTVGDVEDVPRPTDRAFTFNMFMQDYLPRNERLKANINLSVGSGLPFGRPENNLEARNPFRFRPYHRLDIGFAFHLWDEKWKADKPQHPFRFAKGAWLTLEAFNLMAVSNTASNIWIKAFTNVEYAIPNDLTSRRLNLRLRVDL